MVRVSSRLHDKRPFHRVPLEILFAFASFWQFRCHYLRFYAANVNWIETLPIRRQLRKYMYIRILLLRSNDIITIGSNLVLVYIYSRLLVWAKINNYYFRSSKIPYFKGKIRIPVFSMTSRTKYGKSELLGSSAQFGIWWLQVQNIGHFASEQGELDSCLNPPCLNEVPKACKRQNYCS